MHHLSSFDDVGLVQARTVASRATILNLDCKIQSLPVDSAVGLRGALSLMYSSLAFKALVTKGNHGSYAA